MAISFDKIKEQFTQAGQSQVFQFEQELSVQDQTKLYEELFSINPQEVNDNYQRAKSEY